MAKHEIIIATRESPLALWQAEWVKERLQALHPQLVVRLLGMTTSGDQIHAIPLTDQGGKGLFVKELEEALLDGRADIAVHSMKDVPMEFPPGLVLPVICEREDPSDAFVANQYENWQALPADAVVGTSSLRRQSQFLALRPQTIIKNLRGNVGTRLAKLDNGEFDAIILASAGLRRLRLEQRIRTTFDSTQLLPAAGQGALGIECRQHDAATLALIAPLLHPLTHACVTAERAMCKRLGGGCQVPVAAYATQQTGMITLHGLVAQPDGHKLLRTAQQGNVDEVESIGIRAAEALLSQGAADVLRGIY